MAVRSPGDAVVVLRSLGRRYRSLFAGLGDDESPEALAVRPGADGRSAADHIGAALDALVAGDGELDRALGARGTVTGWLATTLDQRLDELTRVAGDLANRAERVPADQWATSGASLRALDGRGHGHRPPEGRGAHPDRGPRPTVDSRSLTRRDEPTPRGRRRRRRPRSRRTRRSP